MKKNLLIITCLFALLGCAKNNNNAVLPQADNKKSINLNIPVDSVKNNDTTKKERSKTINNVSCAYSKIYA